MQLDKFYILGVTHKDLTLKEREAFVQGGPKKIMEDLLEDGLLKVMFSLKLALELRYIWNLKI